MRRLEFAVPDPVLTSHARRALAKASAAAGGLWLSAETALDDPLARRQDQARGGDALFDETALSAPDLKAGQAALKGAGGLDSASGRRPPLWPLDPPHDEVFWPLVSGAGAAFVRGPQGRAMLTLTAGVNGGYGDLEPLRRLDCFSAAVIWAPGDEPAKTLFTLRGDARSANYLFLSEEAPGLVVLRDNDGGVRLEAPLVLPKGQDWAAAMISVRGDQVLLALSGQAAVHCTGLKDLPERGRLMLGCRAARDGMPKSLGAARISDLLYWPGIAVLQDEAAGCDANFTPALGAAQASQPGAATPHTLQPGQPLPHSGQEAPHSDFGAAQAVLANLRHAFDAFCLWEL